MTTTQNRVTEQSPPAKDAKSKAAKNGSPANGHAAKNGAASNGRDANGRFAPGNCGGPGNPFARHVAEARKLIANHISDEIIKEGVEKLVELMRQGSVAAIKLLFAYKAGKPSYGVEPDLLAQHEWKILKSEAAFDDDMRLLTHRPGPMPNLHFVRVMREDLSERLWDMLDKASESKPPQKKALPVIAR